MPNVRRGEVWWVDLGLTAKIRPAVVFNVPFRDNERALYTIVPHTTALRGGRFEVLLNIEWLENGGFDVQGMRPVPGSSFARRIGVLNSIQMEAILRTIKIWLEIP